jgi:hypothetical protein
MLPPPPVSLSATSRVEDLSVLGFYVPALMAWALLALLVFVALHWLMAATGLYRFVWHRALFGMALYVVILGGIVLGGSAGWL